MNKYSPRQLIDDVLRQFSESTGARAEHKDIPVLLASLLRKLHLVTREEFDAQTAVLARTRKKLQELEAQIADLESKIK